MAFYATSHSGLVGQEEMEAKRKLEQQLKQIGEQQACVMINLQIWLRNKQDRGAMERLLEARSEENRLFRELFGIEDSTLKIGKARG